MSWNTLFSVARIHKMFIEVLTFVSVRESQNKHFQAYKPYTLNIVPGFAFLEGFLFVSFAGFFAENTKTLITYINTQGGKCMRKKAYICTRGLSTFCVYSSEEFLSLSTSICSFSA